MPDQPASSSPRGQAPRKPGPRVSMSNLAARGLKKLAWLVVMLFGITIISFTIIHLAPGSPTDMATDLNPMADSDAREKLEQLYGLDKPLHVQYISWISRLARLDFGNSMSNDPRPVLEKIAERLPLTLGLNLASLLLTLLIAIPIGVIAARKKDRAFDRATTVLVYIGFSMPSFWLALLLMMQFAIDWHWLPASGLTSLNYNALTTWGKCLDLAKHLAMPLFIYTFCSLASLSRYMRSSMIEVLRQDYIVTAKAKGASERRVTFHHALRNALLPLITILGLSIPGLIGGSVIIESIFGLPGLGQLFYSAVMQRDYSMIMGNLVLGAVLTLLGNLLADLSYSLADPRVRAN